jgi:hypothetical protein
MVRRTAVIQSAILSELMQQGPCTLETLLDRLPQFSWTEIFAVVDQLSRVGRLVLRHPSRFDYEVSIGPTMQTSEQARIDNDDAGDFGSGSVDPSFQPQEEPSVAMICHRCQGLMTKEELRDWGGGRGNDWSPVFRCISCGDIIDRVILTNRERRGGAVMPRQHEG